MFLTKVIQNKVVHLEADLSIKCSLSCEQNKHLINKSETPYIDVMYTHFAIN